MLEFVKQRINEGNMGDGFKECDWDKSLRVPALTAIKDTGLARVVDPNCTITDISISLSVFDRKIKLIYNTKAQYDYLASHGVVSTGESYSALMCTRRVIENLLTGSSYGKDKYQGLNPLKYDVEYTIGDIFIADYFNPLTNKCFYGAVIPVKYELKTTH